MPETWRRPAHWRPRLQLVGAGLGLFGVRQLPLVGREDEQDRLWGALAGVARTGRPQGVVLRGQGGLGKSRLAHWIAERAQELGAALPLRAVHDATGGLDQGLVGMLRHHLRCGDLQGKDLAAQLYKMTRRWPVAWSAAELEGLARVLSPGDPNEARARFALINRALSRLGWGRPVVVVLEDVHWSAESVRWATDLLAGAGGPPVLVVATIDDEDLGLLSEDRHAEVQGLESVAEVLRLQPLTDRASDHLVEEILGLRGSAADRISEHAAGNPLYAIQLVGDLVRRGALQPAARGFELAPGARLDALDDGADAWLARVDATLRRLDLPDSALLELAAVLGPEFDEVELQAAAAQAELPPQLPLGDRGLAPLVLRSKRPGTWVFVHPQLRNALLRRSAAEGRVTGLHRAVADSLKPRSGADERERRAHHLSAGGDPEGALALLQPRIRERLDDAFYSRSRPLLAAWDRAAAAARLSPDDLRRAEPELLRASVARHDRRWADAREILQGVDRIAAAHDRADLHAWAAILDARCVFRTGTSDEGVAAAERGLALARAAGVDRLIGHAMFVLGVSVGVRTKDRTRAMTHLHEVIRNPAYHYSPDALAASYKTLAQLTVAEGDVEQGAEWFRKAIEASNHRVGHRIRFLAANDYGATLAELGRYAEAEAELRRGLLLADEHGSAAPYPLANLGVCLLEQGRTAEAEATLHRALRAAEVERTGWLPGAIVLDLARCAAVQGHWPVFDDLLLRAQSMLPTDFCFDPAFPRHLAQCAEQAEAAGKADSARLAWSMAAQQARLKGEDEQADALAARAATPATPPAAE